MNVTACLHYLFQNAPDGSWELNDYSDGTGIHIENWKLPDPIPTMAELQAVDAIASAWWIQKQFRRRQTVEWTDLKTDLGAMTLSISEVTDAKSKAACNAIKKVCNDLKKIIGKLNQYE